MDRTPAGRVASRTMLGLPADRETVASVGGSLGARRINGAVAELAESWAGLGSRSIYHVTGRRDYAAFARMKTGPASRFELSCTGSSPSRTA